MGLLLTTIKPSHGSLPQCLAPSWLILSVTQKSLAGTTSMAKYEICVFLDLFTDENRRGAVFIAAIFR
jgi:hypothetical protein